MNEEQYYYDINQLQNTLIDFGMKYFETLNPEISKSFQIIQKYCDNEREKTEKQMRNNFRRK